MVLSGSTYCLWCYLESVSRPLKNMAGHGGNRTSIPKVVGSIHSSPDLAIHSTQTLPQQLETSAGTHLDISLLKRACSMCNNTRVLRAITCIDRASPGLVKTIAQLSKKLLQEKGKNCGGKLLIVLLTLLQIW